MCETEYVCNRLAYYNTYKSMYVTIFYYMNTQRRFFSHKKVQNKCILSSAMTRYTLPFSSFCLAECSVHSEWCVLNRKTFQSKHLNYYKSFSFIIETQNTLFALKNVYLISTKNKRLLPAQL